MDYKTLWENILTRLTSSISAQHLLSFFKDLIIVQIQDGVMTLAVPTPMAFNFIRARYEAKIFQAAQEVSPEIKELRMEVKGSLADQHHPHKADATFLKSLAPLSNGIKQVRKVPQKQEVLLQDGMRSKMFNPQYTLQNFIPGNANRLIHAACMAVAAKPGDIYNPLYLYGGVGLGKTHLLQATGLEILKNYNGKNVVYMTSERFIHEIVEAIGKKHTNSFKERYRKVDCLIVDDIQFFGNKASSQQEFFHTFNELYDAGKQIIISSDRPPKELDELEERLKSRFAMGMVVEVNVPDFETRLAILNARCQEHQVLIDREVLEFIAYNVHHSIREMEGILTHTIAVSQLTETNPTIRSVADAIRKLHRDVDFQDAKVDVSKKIIARSMDDVIDIVASYYKLTKSDLLGEERRREVMIARQVCMYLIREILSYSYESIGESFGGRNHTTVLHAYHKVLQQLRDDTRVRRDVNALKKEIGL